MKGISLEKQHLRQTAVRTLTTASCIGGFLTFLCGAWIVPWVVAVGPWLVHQIPWWHQAGAFPNLLSALAAPNFTPGFIWLGYYIVTYLWAAATLSPRQKRELRAQIDREYRKMYGDDEWGFHWSTSAVTEPKKEDIPLSQAWPGELKHQLVEHCYQEYRKALKRFDPPPIDLKTPGTFFYRKAGKIEWMGPILVLPEHILTPERIHELLPFLAHSLYDYNAEKTTTETTGGFPDYVPLAAPLLCITGNFLWLPVTCKHRIESKARTDFAARQRHLVLSRDEFAVYLGQGPDLKHQLQRMEEALKERHQIDGGVPTLIERIGRMEVLIERERKEMRALGLTPNEPPLVVDPPFSQIGKGKKPRQ